MYSKKFYSFDPRNSRTQQHDDSNSTRGSSQATFTKRPYEPVEGKIDRENHVMKEDTRSISENVTKSVVTRNVIDRRSSSSYTTREDIKAIKTRDLKGITNTFKGASKFDSTGACDAHENSKDCPISSFYSSYSRDEDLSKGTAANTPAMDGEKVISSFYRSDGGKQTSDQQKRSEEKDRVSAGASKYTEWTSELELKKREDSSVSGKEDWSDPLSRRRSLERHRSKGNELCDSDYEDFQRIGLEDVNILRRTLERKQASNSLEREKLSKRISEDERSDPSKYTSSAYLLLSNKWKDKDSASSALSEDSSNTRYNDDAVKLSRSPARRSLSSEALDNKERGRLGIYRELPGRKEFLSYTAKKRFHEDDEVLQKRRGSRSLDRDERRMQDYMNEREAEKRDLLFRVRSKSSGHLSSFDNEVDGAKNHNRSRSHSLHRCRSTESDRFRTGDVESAIDFSSSNARAYMPRKESATHEKLKQDITRLKAETESRPMKKDGTFTPKSHSREPSVKEKLKEDIAKLKTETLTREHIKPYIPPPSSRVESKDVSSRWKSREPSIQDKLKDDIAKLRAKTRDFTSFSRRASDSLAHRWHKNDEERNVHRSELRHFQLSKKDGEIFKDESERKETQRYDDPMDRKYGYSTHIDGDLSTADRSYRPDGRTEAERNPKDGSSPKSLDKHYGATYDDNVSSHRRFRENSPTGYFSRAADYDWPPREERSLNQRGVSWISPRNSRGDATQGDKETRSGATQGFATKRVFKADSTVSMKSTKNGDGPSSVTGFFHGSVSEEDQSAFYSKGMGDEDVGDFREPFKRRETFRPTEVYGTTEPRASDSSIPPEPTREYKPSTLYLPLAEQPEGTRRTESIRLKSPPKPTVRPEAATPLPPPDHDSVSRKREDFNLPLKECSDFNTWKEVENKEIDVLSNRRQTSREFVTRKILHKNSIISPEGGAVDSDPSISRLETLRRLPGKNVSPRRTSIRKELLTHDDRKIPSREEVVEIVEVYKESKPSAMVALRKKIEELKKKVDKLDDSKSRSKLEKYVHQHSEKKPGVEIKDPVHIPRYQPRSARLPERDYKPDPTEAYSTGANIGDTSETISRQISRQTSVASTMQRMTSIREEDLTTMSIPDVATREDDGQTEEKPALRDAETMTAPDIQEQVGLDKIRRLDSSTTDIAEDPDQIDELRGVPFDHSASLPDIPQVEDGNDTTTSGTAIIHIDSQQQLLSPQVDKHAWWDAFTAEDVDRLLQIESRNNFNGYTSAYTAEDMDKLLHLGPVRRRSFRRGSYDRSSLRRHSRRSKDDIVDVHVRVRAKQEKRRRPRYIIAQAAPEEKAIVLRDTKENADPQIRKIKVDDVYGADAVRVENGVVKIKAGDLTTRGRKAWARILQKKDRIVESDGTVTIPINRDEYEDGVYYTNYYEEQDQDGVVRVPIRFKIQEDNRYNTKALHVTKEIKRHGSMKRGRRAAGSRAYIVGARYYHGNKLMSTVLGYGSRGQQQRTVLRALRGSSKVAGNEIVVRRNQPYTVPMHTIQRMHEGYRTTRQASSYQDEGGNMVITVNAVPARPPRLSLQKPGKTLFQSSGMLTSNSDHGNARAPQGALAMTPNFGVSTLSRGTTNPDGYTVHAISGGEGTYIVTDPSDSYRRRSSGSTDTSRFHATTKFSSTPIIVPYEGDVQPSSGTGRRIDIVADPSSFIHERSSRKSVSDGRLNARTAYGERFNLKDYGNVTRVQYVNGPRRGSAIINDRRWGNRRYKFGPPSNYKQQERLDGRTMSWAVEEGAPDF